MDSLAGLIGTAAAAAAAIAAYVQLVLVRAIYPCLEVELGFEVMGRRTATGEIVGELELVVRNIGPGVGAVAAPWVKLCFARGEDLGSRHALEPDLRHDAQGADKCTTWFALVPKNDELGAQYIQSGVTQSYRRPFQLPTDTEIVGVWTKFDYMIKVGPIAWAAARWLTARPETRDVTYSARRTFFIVGDGMSTGQAYVRDAAQ